MKLEALSKKLLIGLFLFVLIAALGVTLGWRLLTPSFIENKINDSLKNLPSNVSIDMDNLSIKRNFPYLTISISKVKLNYKNNAIINIENINDKLSVLKFIESYVAGKNYYGSIHTRYADIEIKQSKKKSGLNMTKTFPLIPVDIKIDSLNISYTKFQFSGSLNGFYHPIIKSYGLRMRGLVNKIPLNCSATIKKSRISADFEIFLRKIGKAGVGNIKGKIDLESPSHFNVSLASDYLLYKTINIEKPEVFTTFDIEQGGYSISDFKLKSHNGYFLHFKGFVNKKKMLDSEIYGKVSTPFINIKPVFAYLPKKINDYLFQGYVSLANVEFGGKPSLSFVKKGRVYVNYFMFRIDKKSSNFFIKNGVVSITPTLFKASASGNFEKVLFKNSKITIHRTKGYPCDMDLNYNGTANDLARVFLEENIFSKNDMKVLGKTEALAGKFSATTKVEDYRWKAEPYFNFDVVIRSNGVEFYNSNIPSKFIQSWGVVEIKRVVRKGKVNSLFVQLRDLRAKGFASTVSTKKFTIFIKPKLVLKGSFNANLSKNDMNYLIDELLQKRVGIVRNGVQINASINGGLKSFKFQAGVNYTAYITNNSQLPLKASFSGSFNNPTVTIKKFTLNNLLSASGRVNMSNFSFDLKLLFRKLNINYIRNLFFKNENAPIKSGILTGNVNVIGDIKNPLKKITGKVNIENGFVSDNINSIKADISFDKTKAFIENATLSIFKVPVKLNGFVDYEQTLKINLISNVDNLTLDLDNIKFSTGSKKSYFKIPKLNIDASLRIKHFTIKDKKRKKVVGKTDIEIVNTKTNGLLKLASKYTNIAVIRKNRNIDIKIKDYNFFALLTGCDSNKNFFEMKANLKNSDNNTIDIKNLEGNIFASAKNGEFKNVSNTLKLLSLTNIVEIIFGKSKPQKSLPYKKIEAPLYIKKGVLYTQKNDLAALYGKNLDIFAKGKYDIMKKYVDIYATFTTFRSVNRLISKIPVIGWIIGGKERSFTGVNVHIKGSVDKKISVKPVPLEGLSKGFFGILKRTLMLPLNAVGVSK